MGVLQDGMELLISLGLVDVILPFLLIFGISFGILQKIKLFGKTGNYRNYNALISFCLGFFVVYNFNIVDSLPEFIARIGILFVVMLAIAIVSGILGLNKKFNSKWMTIAILIYLIYTILDVYFPNFKLLVRESIVVTVVTVAIFVAIIYFVLRPEKNRSPSTNNSSSSKTSSDNNSEGKVAKKESKPTQEAPKQDELAERPRPQGTLRRNPSAGDFNIERGREFDPNDLKKL